MADDLTVSRVVADASRDGGKQRPPARGKRRPAPAAPAPAPAPATTEDPPGEAPPEHRVDLLV